MTRARRHRVALTWIALVLLGAGCGSTGSTPVASTASTKPIASPADESRSVSTPRLAWRACNHGFTCAAMHAPLDYARPAGPTLDIAVARLPARRPSERIGALFVNPGGPGASAVDFARAVAPSFPGSIRDRFDIVAVEPRGIGASHGLDCDQHVAAMYAADPTIETPADTAALLRTSRAFVDDCERADGAVLAHLGTRDAARDIDLVRRGLGDRQLSYLGYSYGTALGQVYAELFPGQVRAMVLDGAVVLGETGVAGARLQAAGFEQALRSFGRWCQRQTDCPIGDDPIGAIDRLTARVERAGVPAPGHTRRAGPAELALAMAEALYDDASWPDLAQALDQARRGDGGRLVAMADQYVRTLEFAPYFAVSCLDSSWPGVDQLLAAAKRIGRASPHFGEAVTTDYLRCSLWPVPPDPLDAPTIPALAPAVVVSTTGDPATPYAQGVEVARQLPGARLVTHVGEGHGIAFQGDGCIDDALTHYLVDLALPARGLRCD